jgi:hypothetical protein
LTLDELRYALLVGCRLLNPLPSSTVAGTIFNFPTGSLMLLVTVGQILLD